MTGRPPRYGDDTWYAVIGYEGDPHILAYRREHPDHITVPLRWKNPPEPRNTKTATPRPASRASFQLPHPDDMLTVAEFKAIMAEARAATPPARQPDDLLIPIQNSRGRRGPRPPGARRDWTPLELWNQHRIDNARTRLAEIEPRNPMLQSLEPRGTPPTPQMADAMEAELVAARGRESRGEPAPNRPAEIRQGGAERRNLQPDIIQNPSSIERERLMEEMTRNGVKFTRDNIIHAERLIDGRIVFLENGNEQSGFAHILSHQDEFIRVGVQPSQIPEFLFTALRTGRRVGEQGSGGNRPIFELQFGDRTLRVGITVSDNGYIVGANMRSTRK